MDLTLKCRALDGDDLLDLIKPFSLSLPLSLSLIHILKHIHLFSLRRRYTHIGGSPGLVVKGVDSCSEGREFESRHRILDGHFFTLICLKKTKINKKRPRMAHLKKVYTHNRWRAKLCGKSCKRYMIVIQHNNICNITINMMPAS